MVPRDGKTDTAGVGIGGGVGSAMPGSTGHAGVYLDVPDIAEAHAGVDELGGTRPWSPFQTSDGTAPGRFADPEGQLIGLISTIG